MILAGLRWRLSLANNFRYRGIKADGSAVEGRISASTRQDAILELAAQRINPYEVNADDGSRRRFVRRRARPADRQRLIRQLAMLVKAGSPLLTSVDTLLEDEPCEELSTKIRAVKSNLKAGGRLSIAINEHLPELPDYVARLVELGEATGSLPERLSESASQMERDQAAADEVRNALAYPAFLACAGLIAVMLIFSFVVPRFAALLDQSGSDLPVLSQIVLQTGIFFNQNSLLIMGVIIALIAGAFRAAQTPRVRKQFVSALFRVPVASGFLKAVDTARWARVVGASLVAGSNLLDAMALAERGIMSDRKRAGLSLARKAVRSGEPLEEALRTHTDFEAMTLNLVRTGRLSGALDEMLLFIAETEEAEARNRAKRLTALAEPLAIVFIAGIIGLIVISLVLAMSSLYDFQI